MATHGGSSSSNPARMVTFKTSDDEEVKVSIPIASLFSTVREFFDGDLDRPEVENAAPFPLVEVESRTLRTVVHLGRELLHHRSKFEALEKERLFELPSKYQALEKEWQKFEAEFFGRQSDETIVKLVKAADFLEIKELLDSVMPSFRKRFGLGDDKGVDFVYTAEIEAILLRRAASASGGAGS